MNLKRWAVVLMIMTVFTAALAPSALAGGAIKKPKVAVKTPPPKPKIDLRTGPGRAFSNVKVEIPLWKEILEIGNALVSYGANKIKEKTQEIAFGRPIPQAPAPEPFGVKTFETEMYNATPPQGCIMDRGLCASVD